MNFLKQFSTLFGLLFLFSLSVQAQRTATAVATVVNGFVVSITVLDGGIGYSNAPLVTISGAGISAQAIATVSNGAVDNIIVKNAGCNYSSNTVVSIAVPFLTTLPFSNGLVAYFPFNGNANDESGNNLHAFNGFGNMGVTSDENSFTADRFGVSYSSLSINKYVYPSHPGVVVPVFNTNLSQVTLSFWIHLEAYQSYEARILDQNWPDGAWCVAIRPSGKIVIYNTYGAFESSSPLRLNAWNHVCASVRKMNSATMEMVLFLNGNRSASLNYNGKMVPPNGPFYIGGHDYDLTAVIDDVRIYNYALSGQEVENLFAFETPEQPWLSINVKSLQVKMHVKPTKIYQLESSFDLIKWTSIGLPFLAATAEIDAEFNIDETGRYFRLYEVQ